MSIVITSNQDTRAIVYVRQGPPGYTGQDGKEITDVLFDEYNVTFTFNDGSTISTTFSGTVSVTISNTHSSLLGLQGGTIGQYYHLSNGDYLFVTSTAPACISALFATLSNYSTIGHNHITLASLSGNTLSYNRIFATTATLGLAQINEILFNTTYASVSNIVGSMRWNIDDGTAEIVQRGGNVIQQIGQETFLRIKNTSGFTILNGKAVMSSGAEGNSGRITVTLAHSVNGDNAKYILGIATENINNGEEGYVTNFGVVRSIKTNGNNYGETWVDGTVLWIHPTISGELTMFEPPAPYMKMAVAFVVNAHGTNGSLFVRIHSNYDTKNLHDVSNSMATISGQYLRWNGSYYEPSHTASLSTATITDIFGALDGNDLIGFDTRIVGSRIAFNNSTRTFSIWPTSTSYIVYINNHRKNISTTKSVVIPSTINVLNFIYFDENEVLQVSSSFPDPVNALVAAVYWNGIEGFLLEERHGTINKTLHSYLHRTVNTRYDSGFAFSVINSNQLVGSSGVIWDEDLRHNITTPYNASVSLSQTLSPIAQLPVLYRDNTDGRWIRQFNSSSNVNPWLTTSGVLSYNTLSGGSWTLSTVPNGNYVAYWLTASNFINFPVFMFAGQRIDGNLTNAQNNNTLNTIQFGTIPSAELKVLYRVIFRILGGVISIVQIDDYRTSSSLPLSNYSATDHSALSGLSTSGHPANVISFDTTNINNILSTLDTTVQSALDRLDNGIIPSITLSSILDTDQIIVNRGTLSYSITGSLFKQAVRDSVFFAGTIAPSNTSLIWIDTN